MLRCTSSLLLIAIIASVRPLHAQGSSVHQLSWMAGCWRQSNPASGRMIDEQWMAPMGRTMLGMARTVRGDSTIEFEHLQILERGGHAIFHAEPSGQAPADFEARSVSDSLVTFENPAHDFPQRVIYRRKGRDSLIARIEGTRNGRVRGVDFPYARAACPE
jgi:hypothetical protein